MLKTADSVRSRAEAYFRQKEIVDREMAKLEKLKREALEVARPFFISQCRDRGKDLRKIQLYPGVWLVWIGRYSSVPFKFRNHLVLAFGDDVDRFFPPVLRVNRAVAALPNVHDELRAAIGDQRFKRLFTKSFQPTSEFHRAFLLDPEVEQKADSDYIRAYSPYLQAKPRTWH